MDKKDIKDLTIEELKREMRGCSVPAYRAEQIFHWIYKKGCYEFSDMKNMPAQLRDALSQIYYIGNIRLKKHLSSGDRTEKFLFELYDRNLIETVLIKTRKRKTVCISTQVGCKYACRFCASGFKGFKRDLSASEILGQILILQRRLDYSITNFVFMGMGEPLDNFENLSKSIIIMNEAKGMSIGARRITVSTCGIVPGIYKLGQSGIQVNLSISLHAVNNKLRDFLMPVNRKYSIEKLVAAAERFINETGRKITLEYLLIRGRNDYLQDISGLSKIARRLRAKVNLIPYSPVGKREFEAPSGRDMCIFKDRLMEKGVDVTVRESKGGDIKAACGQLAMRSIHYH